MPASKNAALMRKLAAIFSADVLRYSGLIGGDDRVTINTLTALRHIMRDGITEHAFQVIHSPGDGVLADSNGTVETIRAALAMQRHLAQRDPLSLEAGTIQVRLGCR